MSEAINIWQDAKVNLKNTDLDSNDTQANASSFRVRGLLGKAFWTLVAVLNVLIVGDILLYSGANLINLFFALTGGY